MIIRSPRLQAGKFVFSDAKRLLQPKAAQCEERARQASDGPQRAFYEVIAHYYGEVATDFRQVIEKRKAG